VSETLGGGPVEPRFVDDARRYRMESRIATGGMGEVWRGTDTTLGRPVAIKVLKAEYADDATFRARFETEARHAAALHHPGVAGVFDFGEARASDGSGALRPYLVMELVDGQPLSALLRPGEPLDPAATAALMAQAADAIGAAHAAGIVHRDVKPANLLVTPDRTIKITDFGIARAAEGMALTQTGQVMGTPQYLSPEQAQGGTATPASDVYSLGVVAFECLAGHRPFVAETAVATALAHLREPVPELPPHVPADLAAVVRRAMSKSPEDRFPDGTAFAAALRDPSSVAPLAAAGGTVAGAAVADAASTQVLGGIAATPPTGPVSGGPDDEPRRRWWLWALLGVLAVVLLVGGIAWALSSGGDQPGDQTPSSSATTSKSKDRSSEPTSSATQEQIVINEGDYVGRDIKDVSAELKSLGLKVKPVRLDNPGDQPEGIVDSLTPTGALDPGTSVSVSYWGKPPPPTTSSTPTTPTTSSTPTDTTPTGATTAPADQTTSSTTSPRGVPTTSSSTGATAVEGREQ
jgi:serine/threonine-protein kinase